MHRQRIFPVFILLFSLILPARPFGFAEEPEKPEAEKQQEVTESEEKPNPFFEHLVPPDRTAMRRFEQAKRLIETQRLAEAAQLLGAILEGPIDFFIAPPFEDEAVENTATRTSDRLFGDLVLETLQGLPSKARESYVLQYDAQARRLLENAVRDGSIEGVQYVSRRYFPTRAGAAATFLLGVDQMDRGACESAALSFGRLNESRADLIEFEPALSLSLAACQLRLGRTDEARKTIDLFRKRMPEPEILLFGKDPWKPASTDEIVAKLKTLHESSAPVSMAAWLERIGWLSNAGSPNQNAETEAEKPLLELLWSVPTLNKPAFEREVRSLMSAARREKGVQIPAARPLVLNDRLLIRGVGELMAVDTRTGKLLWSAAEPEYRIAKSLQASLRNNQQQIRIGGPEGGLSLRLHFWFDHISHQLSSDGRRLFSVDGHNLRDISYAALGPGRLNIRIGRKATEDPRFGPGNTLTARDVETGRILWQAGKFPYVQKFFDRFVEDFEQEEARKKAGAEAAKDGENPNPPPEPRPDRDFTEEERFLGETWFLGAPQIYEGRLHVIGENGGQLRLIILDAEDGHLIRQVPIAVPPSTFESDPVRKFFGLIPSISDGILVCPTALGMIVALDATTATPLWCFSYLTPPKDGAETRNRRNMRNFPFRMGGFDDTRNHFIESGWQMPSIQIDGNRILVAPPDDPSLYCLDLATGRLVWKNADFKRETALYVACIRRNTAYVVMPDGIVAFDMETGRTVWEPVVNDPKTEKEDAVKEETVRLAFPPTLKPAGVGIRNGGLYYLPFPDGILGVVDLDRAEMELMTSGAVARQDSPVRRAETAGPEIPVEGVFIEEEFSGFTPFPVWTPPSSDSVTVNREILLGNLVGIHGRFFSHTPLQIACFDQWAPLERRAKALLEADPENPEGLLQLGRIRRAEKNLPEAVDLFRRAMKNGADAGEYARDCLRGTLRDAVGSDYTAWKQHGDELEKLAEFPEELGESLYLLARGALRHGDSDRFFDVLQKAFGLEIDHSVLVPVDSGHHVQLHRALGFFVRNLLRKASDTPLRTELDRVSETLFQGLLEKKDAGDFLPRLHLNDAGLTKHRFLMRPWWEEEATALSSEARRWQVFLELFQKMPVAERAGNALDEYYERNRLYTALELRINPPVDWGLSEKLFEIPETEGPDESAALTPVPPLPEKKTGLDDLKRSALKRLAEYLLACDNPADALYYRRLLEKHPDGESPSSIPPEIQKRLDREQASAVWPQGRVSVEDEPQTKNEPPPQDPHGAAIASILRGTQHPGRFQANRRSLSFFGSYEPFLSPYIYCLETMGSEVHLLCCDELGEERWKSRISDIAANMSEYGFFSENNIYSILGSMDQTVYLKGCNHLLVFVRDNELIVFDTFRTDPIEGPRVLWTKTLPVKLPNRLMYSAIPLSNLQAYSMQPNRGFPRESLFVAPRVICYRDAERVYGLDPYSGQILWSREALSPHCSILGDRENLFLVYPDIHQAIAVDPADGRELASGTIPAGGLFAFETNIVFVKQATVFNSPNHNRPYQILVGDLRELHQKRRRALLVSDESVQGGIPSIPTWPIREELTHDAMLRQIHHGRFLASVSWTSKTLQMYDLENKTGILGPLGDLGRRTGVKLPDTLLRDSRRRHDSDFDVEILDDKLLVYFIEKGDVDRQMKNVVDERGVPVRQRRDAVNNLPARNFGAGSMMLYRNDGTACWTQPVRLEDWYRVLRVPGGLPVALFAVSMTEQENRNGPNTLYTGLCGIDKRTGETRFRCWVPPLPQNRSQTMLQGFHVQADPWKKEIAFVTPNRTVLAKFTDQKPEPPKPVEEPKPQNNLFDRMFNLFGE